jgi:hypothetical protein
MRKKCISCGLICFLTDQFCKRCGSDNLLSISNTEKVLVKEFQSLKKQLSFWSYLLFFFLAVLIEFIALLPVLANIGMRHSSRAPLTEFEIKSRIVAFVAHLPTILLPYLLRDFDGGIFILITPITQIIFWTCLFSYIARRIRRSTWR